MTLNDLDLEYAHRKLRVILRSVPDTIQVVYSLLFILYGRSARQNQVHQIVKHFDFDLNCDVIGDPKVNNVRFPSTAFPDLSNAF